jgi:tellurite resistance-related uncharacterized protein
MVLRQHLQALRFGRRITDTKIFADKPINRLKNLPKSTLRRYFTAMDAYHRLNITNGQLYLENERLSDKNQRLSQKNNRLREKNQDYGLLSKMFTKGRLNESVEQAEQERQTRRRSRGETFKR